MEDQYDRVLCGPGRRGMYESHYLKANDPDGAGAFWIKYNLLAPREARYPRLGELWAVVWAGPGRRPVVVKKLISERELESHGARLELHLGEALLTTERARGSVEENGRRVRWDLSLTGDSAPLFHFPSPVLYRLPFPKKKILTPRPRQVFEGSLEVDGTRVEVGRWLGLRGHNWGTEHAHQYAYGNANLWDQPDESAFDAFSARIVLGPVLSPWLSLAVWRGSRGEVRHTHPRQWVNPTARVEFPSWSFSFASGSSPLRARWTLNPEDVAGLRYLHPDGRVAYCYNTKFAQLELKMEKSQPERLTTHLAELEFLTPRPIPGIPLHGKRRVPPRGRALTRAKASSWSRLAVGSWGAVGRDEGVVRG